MARPAATLKLEGIEDLNKTLLDLAPNQAKNLLRSTVHGIAGEVRDGVETAAPFPHMRDDGFKAVRRGAEDAKPVSEVRATRHAADWRWFEFGTAERRQKTTGRRAGRILPRPFVMPVVEAMRSKMASIYREQFVEKLQKMLARAAKAAARNA